MGVVASVTDREHKVHAFLKNYHNHLTVSLENLDARARFKEDRWKRSDLGYGVTRVLKGGALFEQAGVNFSSIRGDKVPESLLGHRPDLKGHSFWGAGVSMVLHPLSPFCPTVHLNYRYFQAGPFYWFAGGADLTPYYIFKDDAKLWHQTHKDAMDQFDHHYYPAFKYWCDEYFYNHHREETRGIGGVFYDYQDGAAGLLVKPDEARRSEDKHHPALVLKQKEKSWEQMFAFHQATAAAFLDAYVPIIQKRREMRWGERERAFQLYRRGRYVEFNLLYDRGTLFGLQSKGRVESIFMSLPPLVRWEYSFKPEKESPEALLTERYLLRGFDWLGA